MAYKDQIISLISLLIEKTKAERGYTGTGRLINRILHTLAGVYPINSRFVNPETWEDPGMYIYLMVRRARQFLPDFERSHNLYWGKLYEAQDVKIQWHGNSILSSPNVAFFV